MSVQRLTTSTGTVRFRARVKSHGREVATRVFTRRADAVAWEQEQALRLRNGDWVDPRRARVSLGFVAESWLTTRDSVKRPTRETDHLTWTNYVAPHFATRPIGTITTAEISEWVGQLIRDGRSAGTTRRALATLRAVLDHAMADDRLTRNVARLVNQPRGGVQREGQGLTIEELHALAQACSGPWSDVVLLLGYNGLRWGELAGLQVGDHIVVSAPGLRVQRAVLSGSGGHMFIDTLKNHHARTVPLPDPVVEIVDARCAGRATAKWIFPTTVETPLHEGNWKRSVHWENARRVGGITGASATRESESHHG